MTSTIARSLSRNNMLACIQCHRCQLLRCSNHPLGDPLEVAPWSHGPAPVCCLAHSSQQHTMLSCQLRGATSAGCIVCAGRQHYTMKQAELTAQCEAWAHASGQPLPAGAHHKHMHLYFDEFSSTGGEHIKAVTDRVKVALARLPG